MKRIGLISMVLGFAAMLLVSCDDDRFDFSELESVNAAGQWNVPIGTTELSFEMVLNQLENNDYVTYDEEGNLQLTYSYRIDTVVIGSDFMRYDDMEFLTTAVLENPYPYLLEEPLEDTLHVEQKLVLEEEGISLLTAKVRTGQFGIEVDTDVERVRKIIVRSPEILDANGNPLVRELVEGENLIDLDGVKIIAQELNTINFIYDICYEAYEYTGPEFIFHGLIRIHDLKIQEMSGVLAPFSTPFRLDTTFSLPLDNIDGEITFVGANLSFAERNSFMASVQLRLDTAMLYGDHSAPTDIFDEYPMVLDVNFTPQYTPFFSQNFDLDLNSDFHSFLVSGECVFNPAEEMVTLCDTATIGLNIDGVLPISFKIPEVTYEDTLDLDVSGISAPELIKEVLLHADFASELPFNFKAQLLTMEDGVTTDSLFVTPPIIQGSFDGGRAITNTEIPITHQKLDHLMNANHMLLRLGVDTEQNQVTLNLKDKLSLTLRADVVYDGDITDL